jgi:hypothetical protein
MYPKSWFRRRLVNPRSKSDESSSCTSRRRASESMRWLTIFVSQGPSNVLVRWLGSSTPRHCTANPRRPQCFRFLTIVFGRIVFSNANEGRPYLGSEPQVRNSVSAKVAPGSGQHNAVNCRKQRTKRFNPRLVSMFLFWFHKYAKRFQTPLQCKAAPGQFRPWIPWSLWQILALVKPLYPCPAENPNNPLVLIY